MGSRFLAPAAKSEYTAGHLLLLSTIAKNMYIKVDELRHENLGIRNHHSYYKPATPEVYSQHQFGTNIAKMHFYASIPALLALVLSVKGLPCDQTILSGQPETNQTKTAEHVFVNLTANGGLYLCENAGFGGYCVHYTNPFGQCSKCPHESSTNP
jgi:hypothetical protein